MDEVQLRQAPGLVVESRKVPIAHLNVTATVIGSAETLFTVRDDVAFEVKRLAVANTTGSAATLSLHTVPSGGTAGVGNAEFMAVNVPANSSSDLTDYIGGLYDAGTTFEVYAGTNGALTVHGWGEEIL